MRIIRRPKNLIDCPPRCPDLPVFKEDSKCRRVFGFQIHWTAPMLQHSQLPALCIQYQAFPFDRVRGSDIGKELAAENPQACFRSPIEYFLDRILLAIAKIVQQVVTLARPPKGERNYRER